MEVWVRGKGGFLGGALIRGLMLSVIGLKKNLIAEKKDLKSKSIKLSLIYRTSMPKRIRAMNRMMASIQLYG